MAGICDLYQIIEISKKLFMQFDYVKDVKATKIEPVHTVVLSVSIMKVTIRPSTYLE